MNQAHLENGTKEQIVTHLQKELECYGLEAPDELQLNTVSQHATNSNAQRPKPTCHHCTKPGHYRNPRRIKKGKKNCLKILKIFPETKTVASITLSQKTTQK